MNDIRARFEEVWPVPEGVYWHEETSEYWTNNHTYEDSMDEWNARLDTFTRCQETKSTYRSLIGEMIDRIEDEGYGHIAWLARAKQIMRKGK